MHIYWLLKSSCFNLFRNGKYGLFLSQKVDWKMIFTDYWKGLVLNFSVMGNIVFFESRSWWKDDIYWLLRSSCFEIFGDGKYGLFFRQNVDGKMIFTWSFWAFYDMPGPGKHDFSHSACDPLRACSDKNTTGHIRLKRRFKIKWFIKKS